MSILHVSDFHVGKDDEIKRKKIENLVIFLNENKKEITNIVFSGDVIDAREAVIEARKAIITDESNIKRVDSYRVKMNKDIKKQIDSGLKKITDVSYEIPSGKKVTYGEIIDNDEELTNYMINDDDTFTNFAKTEKLTNKFKKIVNDNRKTYFKNAEKIFDILKENLKVKSEDIILCPGNHDVARYKQAEECNDKKLTYEEEEYKLFNDFSKKVTSKKIPDYETREVDCDGYKFIVINSNLRYYQKKGNKGCCIDCQSLDDLLIENKYDKKKTVVVCHKPISDFCESARLRYENNTDGEMGLKETFVDKMRNCASLFLCGDKHASEELQLGNTYSYMAGSLGMDECTYYIIDLGEGKPNVETISCYSNNWRFKIEQEKCEKSYNSSKVYLKNMAFEMIEGDRKAEILKTDYSNMINSITNCFENGRLKHIEKFFKGLFEGVSFNRLSLSDFFIQNTDEGIMEITGTTGVGKSSLLSYTYLKLLYLADKEKKGILPFYYNFSIDDDDFKKDDDIIQVISNKFDEFEKYYDEALQIARNDQIILFVDGLDGKANWTKEIADGIENQVLSFLNRVYNENNHRIVVGISSFKNRPNKKYSIEELEYEKIVNTFTVSPIKIEADFDKLSSGAESTFSASRRNIEIFQCYGEIFSKKMSESTINDIVKKCLSSGIVNMSLSFLRYVVDNSNYLGKNIYNIYLVKNTQFLTKEISKDNIKKMRVVAYKYLYTDRSFEDLVNDEEAGISLKFAKYFQIIKDKPDLQIYLAAEYYYEQLKENKKSKKRDEVEEKYNILYNFFDKDISCIVRFNMEKNGDYDKFRTWFDENSQVNLSKQLYCSLLYLLSRSKDKGNRELQTKDLSKIENRGSDKKDAEEKDKEFLAFYKRANSLSYWMITRHLDDNDNYLKTLFLSSEDRLFNRQYMRYYYRELLISESNLSKPWSERMLNEKIYDKDDVSESSINYCFFSIRNSLSTIDKIDHVALFYLFTLCDLVYSELQNDNSSVLKEDNKSRLTPDMLNESICLIDRTLKLPVDSGDGTRSSLKLSDRNEETYRCLDLYFRYMRNVFEHIFKHFNDKGIKAYCDSYNQFQRIISVKDCFRCGWKINKAEISQEKYDSIKRADPGYTESYQEFLFEIINLAQMILPASLNDRTTGGIKLDDYKKELVLQMLIMFPTGFYSRKYDVTPLLSNVNLRIEDEKIKDTIKFNIIFNILDGSDQYELLQVMMKGSDNINYIIFEEIKTIFLEYKYYYLMKNGKLKSFTKERKEQFIKDFENSGIKYLSYERENLLKYLKGDVIS
ncbi:MAG: hypothetical protein J6X97_09160 [Lachnospiraceae bacterium]|nr:hypothetical protein [Lachnospiraceae bacterium]